MYTVNLINFVTLIFFKLNSKFKGGHIGFKRLQMLPPPDPLNETLMCLLEDLTLDNYLIPEMVIEVRKFFIIKHYHRVGRL